MRLVMVHAVLRLIALQLSSPLSASRHIRQQGHIAGLRLLALPLFPLWLLAAAGEEAIRPALNMGAKGGHLTLTPARQLQPLAVMGAKGMAAILLVVVVRAELQLMALGLPAAKVVLGNSSLVTTDRDTAVGPLAIPETGARELRILFRHATCSEAAGLAFLAAPQAATYQATARAAREAVTV